MDGLKKISACVRCDALMEKDRALYFVSISLRGRLSKALTDSQHIAVRLRANGFGKLADLPSEVRAECLWDWSHVRDSSSFAMEDMVMLLLHILPEEDARSAFDEAIAHEG